LMGMIANRHSAPIQPKMSLKFFMLVNGIIGT
jgi:hypothetical protein